MHCVFLSKATLELLCSSILKTFALKLERVGFGFGPLGWVWV